MEKRRNGNGQQVGRAGEGTGSGGEWGGIRGRSVSPERGVGRMWQSAVGERGCRLLLLGLGGCWVGGLLLLGALLCFLGLESGLGGFWRVVAVVVWVVRLRRKRVFGGDEVVSLGLVCVGTGSRGGWMLGF